MTAEPLFIPQLSDQLGPVPGDSILSRTLHKDAHANVVLFAFAPGQALSEHTAAGAALIQILSGDAAITLGDQAYTAHPGSWMYLPPRLPHSVTAQTAVTMLLIMLPKPAAESTEA